MNAFLIAHEVITEAGGGQVRRSADGVDLVLPAGTGQQYSNAQIADYDLRRPIFRWKPPVTLTVRARASASGDHLRGTAGFGFWNHPFSPDMGGLPRLPQAIWFFFASPPSDMALARGVPGCGWKAAQIDAARARLLALLPIAPAAALAYRSPRLYDRWFPPLQQAMRIGETALDPGLLADWHTYTMDWRMDGARFSVDGTTVLETAAAPRGPCGFIAWMDTRWAVVTPQGHFGAGLTPIEQAQSLTLGPIEIE